MACVTAKRCLPPASTSLCNNNSLWRLLLDARCKLPVEHAGLSLFSARGAPVISGLFPANTLGPCLRAA